jgi:hypothetical protein
MWASDLNRIVLMGFEEAWRHDLTAMDALHVAAAKAVGAIELVTTEKPTKPMFRCEGVSVRSIFVDA